MYSAQHRSVPKFLTRMCLAGSRLRRHCDYGDSKRHALDGGLDGVWMVPHRDHREGVLRLVIRVFQPLKRVAFQFLPWLSDMVFFQNGRDEPRVASNVRAPGAHENALLVTDPTPFHQSHRPTGEFFAHQSGCNIPFEASGFMMSANNASGCQWFISTSRIVVV
jgi:hypothetical protein